MKLETAGNDTVSTVSDEEAEVQVFVHYRRYDDKYKKWNISISEPNVKPSNW